MMDMALSWDVHKGAHLQAALEAWINHLEPSSIEDKRYQTAFEAFDEALVGTIEYMKARREGQPEDLSREYALTGLWKTASQAISPLDPDLSDACMMKGLGWTDPTVWDAAEREGLKISVEDMQNARMALNKKRQAARVAARETSEARALRLLQAIYDKTHDTSNPVFVAQLASDVGLSETEAQASWRYLSEKGLIKTFSIPYTARITNQSLI
jgi:predicted acyl esterase